MDTAVSRVFYRHYFFLNVQDIFLFFEGRRARCGTLTCLYRRGLWCFVMQRLRPGFIVEISRTLLGRRVFAERGEMCLKCTGARTCFGEGTVLHVERRG